MESFTAARCAGFLSYKVSRIRLWVPTFLVSPPNDQPLWRISLYNLASVGDAAIRCTIFHEDPAFHWISQYTPNQYRFMNFPSSVSPAHNFFGVVRM